jgi:hypothetical protein
MLACPAVFKMPMARLRRIRDPLADRGERRRPGHKQAITPLCRDPGTLGGDIRPTAEAIGMIESAASFKDLPPTNEALTEAY